MKPSRLTFWFLFTVAMFSNSHSQHLTPQLGWYGGVSGSEILMIRVRANSPPHAVIDSVIYYGSEFDGALKYDTIKYFSSLDNQDCFSTPILGGVTGGVLDGFRTEGCFQSSTQLNARIIYINGFVGSDTSTYFSLSPGFSITDVRRGIDNLPSTPILFNSYPNPFNPTTMIAFALPSRTFVTLRIVDPLGKVVSALISDELPAGHYSRQWNATGLPSGVYYYRLVAGSFSETKKLVLLK